MTSSSLLALACGALLLVQGCTRGPQQTVPLPALERAGGQMAWRGELPCADCDGIDTRLLLRRATDAGQYRLVETFVTGESGARFVDDGGWQRDGDLIRTRGEDGSRRVFALQPDGSLRPSSADGASLPNRETARLRPVSARR